MIKIQLLLFAGLKERFRQGEMVLEVPRGTTARQVVEQLCQNQTESSRLLASIACAVNQVYVKPDVVLHDRDELALIPPVAGG